MLTGTDSQSTRNAPKKPVIFISYSHKDVEWKEKITPHLKLLEDAHEIDIWHDNKINTGAEWYDDICSAMNRAVAAVCLLSADYLSSDFCKKEEIPVLLKRRVDQGMVLLPILIRPCATKTIKWLNGLQIYPADNDPLDAYDSPEESYAMIVEELHSLLKKKTRGAAKKIPLRDRKPVNIRIDISRLPETSFGLIGRDKSFAKLSEAWEDPAKNAVQVIGWGGTGKTSLVRDWLDDLVTRDYGGAERVFAWSFYSQGTDDRSSAADQFIQTALSWFGDRQPLIGSSWARGERLAELVRQQRTLLILDGIERLQYASGEEPGRIHDPALKTLLTELARNNNGLVILTSRVGITDLAPTGGVLSDRIDLDQLTPEAGRALLRVDGVSGSDAELEKIAENFGCHALALSLVSKFLQVQDKYTLRTANELRDLDIPESEGRHAKRVILAFMEYFGESAECDILRIIGLFDRPAPFEAITEIQHKNIKDLSENISGLGKDKLKKIIQKLISFGLLTPTDSYRPGYVDAHPIVREFFRNQLRKNSPEAWTAGNAALFHYFSASTPDKPTTSETMAPLYSAVFHGCRAGLHKNALHDVLIPRIRQDRSTKRPDDLIAYSTLKLNLYGADLAAWSNFVEPNWRDINLELDADDKGLILSKAGYCLQALGRLGEAETAMKIGLAWRTSSKNLLLLANDARYLSELHLLKGDIENSVAIAKMSVYVADKCDHLLTRSKARIRLAVAFHQAGELDDAEDYFLKATELQILDDPDFTSLIAENGFYYCDLLIDRGKTKEAKRLAKIGLIIANKYKLSSVAHALHHLSIGCSHLVDLRLTGAGDEAEAERYLSSAVEELTEAGSMHHMPRGNLARAEFYILTGEWASARQDLDRAILISQRSGMGLFEAESEILYATLALEQGDMALAAKHWKQASKLVDDMGYRRRHSTIRQLMRGLDSSMCA